MKRRNFIRGLGLGSAALATAKSAGFKGDPVNTPLPPFDYGKILTLDDAKTKEGLIMVSFELSDHPDQKPYFHKGKIKVKDAEIRRMKSYFFEQDEDEFSGDLSTYEVYVHENDREVIVLWLAGASRDTAISFRGRSNCEFGLSDILDNDEMELVCDGMNIKANLLLDREIGEISLADFGAKDPGDHFSFLAMADPQGGLPDDEHQLDTRMKIHNAFIQESVSLANMLDFDPLFTVIIGDVCDKWGYEKDLRQMNAFLSELNSPVLYGIGNHETLLQSEFGPGYNMQAFNHFISAQKAINGLDKLLYSFNAGDWHFVVWPDPLRPGFWETHPHYFDWLERDLEKYRDRPTMVFQHVPVHPAGISPHINYAESVFVKRTFLDILSRQGNVKYCLSGHVHIPVRASFKTAVSYRGIQLLNLPAAGYRPRAFGEEDFYGGPSQGIALIHIRGKEASIQYKTVTEEVFDYPSEFPAFDETAYPLWLKYKWELPTGNNIINGDFKDGFRGWARRFVYAEDHDPSNLCEIRPSPGDADRQSLYLYARKRGYMAPGQDRLPQDINRICQAVELKKGGSPSLGFNYRIDGQHSDMNGYCGGYVWIEGYSRSNKVLNLMYSVNKIWVNIGGQYSKYHEVPSIQMGLPNRTDTWYKCQLNILEDQDKHSQGRSFRELDMDRLIINMGVWNINDGDDQPFGMYLDGFRLDYDLPGSSQAGGLSIDPKKEEDKWWRNKIWPWKNIAGEHRYIIATQKK
jgi:hypothetical protein